MARRTLPLVATGFVLIAVLAWSTLRATIDAPPIDTANDRAPPPANTAATTAPTLQSDGLVAARRAADGDHAARDRSTLVVVQHQDGSPAAGAEVRYWPSRGDARLPASLRALQREQDLEATLTEVGAMATTDGAGRVQVATVAGPLCARLDHEYGEWRHDDATDGTVTIVLARDLALRVEVVDDAGRPAPGRIVVADAEFVVRDRIERDDRLLEFGPTDEHGMAVLPHVQAAIPLPSANILEWSMQLSCAAVDDEARQCDVRPEALLQGRPFRLVVPSGGTVEVELVDAHGSPMYASTSLRSEDADPQSASSWSGNRILFCGVPVGRRCVVTANTSIRYAHDQERDKEVHERARTKGIGRVEVDGPTSVADVVKTTLVMPVTFWRLTAQLRLPDSDSETNAEWSTTVVDADGSTWICSGQSPAVEDGRLDIAFFTDTARELRDLQISSGMHGGTAWTLTVPGPIRPETHDLGVLVARPPNEPERLASVVVHLAEEDVTATARVALFVRTEHRLERIATRTERHDDGTLELFGPPTAGPINLRCGHDGALAYAADIEPGSRVEVQLQPAATLTVRLLAPWLPRGALDAEVEPLDEPNSSYTAGRSSDLTFTWDILPPGRYRLVVLLHDERIFESELPPLVVGANVWPADGAPLELRGARVVLATIVAANGRRLGDCAWQTAEPDAQDVPEDLDDRTIESDLAAIILSSPRDLLVVAHGHVPVRLRVPPNDFRVVLEPATKVLVRSRESDVGVRIAYELPSSIDPRLAALDAEAANRPTEFDFADENDAMEVEVPPGSTLVLQKVRGEQAEPPVRIAVGSASPQEIILP